VQDQRQEARARDRSHFLSASSARRITFSWASTVSEGRFSTRVSSLGSPALRRGIETELTRQSRRGASTPSAASTSSGPRPPRVFSSLRHLPTLNKETSTSASQENYAITSTASLPNLPKDIDTPGGHEDGPDATPVLYVRCNAQKSRSRMTEVRRQADPPPDRERARRRSGPSPVAHQADRSTFGSNPVKLARRGRCHGGRRAIWGRKI